MSEIWSVPLPAAVRAPFDVYVNGVLQVPGEDFDVAGRTLLFSRPLAREGRLGAVRWLSIFLGIAGTYRKNDSVDVVYEIGGRRTVAAALPIIPPPGKGGPEARGKRAESPARSSADTSRSRRRSS